MAISGGVTTAYLCRIESNALRVSSTSRLRSECATVDHALQILARGEGCVIAGGDMPTLRYRLRMAGVTEEPAGG